jgi:hypothetical protein
MEIIRDLELEVIQEIFKKWELQVLIEIKEPIIPPNTDPHRTNKTNKSIFLTNY